jgi:WD40 repeat protein
MAAVFLSYARGDDGEPFDPERSFAARLARDLKNRGLDVWFDRLSMPSRSLTFHQEIRDAVAACERLLLIVGPKAVASDYVRQEWQFAYFQADKVVAPILRSGDFPLVPDELKLLHCEDFRDDAQYGFHFDQLVRILREPPPQLGKLIGVPALPPHFLSRTDRLIGIRDALRADLDRPVVISGATARVGVHGMGGIGKSVLASALAHDRKIREAFPDGIVWVGLGPLPNVADLQRRVHRDLGGDGAIENEQEGRAKLKELVAAKAVLLVIDDVWRRSDVDAFNVLGPRCRAMITTRDAGLLTSLGGTHHVVELLTDEEACSLLAQSSGVALDGLPDMAKEIIGECGRLPLAVSLAGGMLRAGTSWQDLIDALREHELEFLEDEHAAIGQHRNLWKTIEVSVQVLPDGDQKRLSELAVFPNDDATPEAVVTMLWEHTGGLSPRQARQLLLKLKQRSLVQLMRSADSASEAFSAVSLHDLIHDFCVRSARRLLGDDRALHEGLLNAYQTKCPNGWASGPEDGYFFNHLREHLVAAGRGSELADLLQDLRWLEAKTSAGLIFDLGNDFSAAQQSLVSKDPRRRLLELLHKALCRDIYFIDRHREEYQQGLFQCLWNSCWWYDCWETAHHYDQPMGGSPAEGARPEPILSTLLASWRAAKTAENHRFVWLRSLRPPNTPLDSPEQRVFSGHGNSVTSVAFSADDRRLASGSWDCTVKIWDVVSGQQLLDFDEHTDRITSVAFSPDGNWIASGSRDKTVRIWDPFNGHVSLTLTGHTQAVTDVAFSPDGRRIASASNDHTIKVWDLSSGQEAFTLKGHTYFVTSVAFSADGNRIVSGSLDHTIKLWNARSGDQTHTLSGHRDGVERVAFSPDGKHIVSGSRDHTIKLWNLSSGHITLSLKGAADLIASIAISPDGKRIAGGSFKHEVKVWDAASGEVTNVYKGHDYIVSSVTFSSNGNHIASGSWDRTVRIWDATNEWETALLKDHTSGVTSLAFSPDGKWIASGSRDQTVKVWDTYAGRPKLTLKGHGQAVTCVAFSPDGKRIASGSDDRTVTVWDASSGKFTNLFEGHTQGVASLAFSPDCQRIASGSAIDHTGGADGTIKVWSIAAREEILTINAHEVGVLSVAFSPDGKWIGSIGEDRAVKLWDAASGCEIWALNGPDSMASVAFSSDGKRLAAIGTTSIRIWETRSGQGLDVFPLAANVNPIASGPPLIPFWASAVALDAAIRETTKYRAIAWFGLTLYGQTMASSDAVWAVADDNHLYIMAVEGTPTIAKDI